MAVRVWWWLALMLAALSLTMESAHVLELPQKLAYSDAMYAAVNGTLYRYFAIVGGAYQVGSLAAVGVLAWLTKRRLVVIGWVLLLAAFVVWLAVVSPVNARISAQGPELWAELKWRWEYGHAAGFVLQVAGLGVLTAAATSNEARRRG